ncbi:MAG: hypothetical protein VB089_00560 [Anaerolineaceae bacterium]|nr:hypothetical protein [Anaerolineaceae bacterium]
MKSYSWRIVLGVLLVAMGVMALLQTTGILPVRGSLMSALFGLFFAGGGAAFLVLLWSDRHANWWAVIPGVILLDLGLLILGDELAPRFMGGFDGTFFLGGISLAFWLVYLLQPEFWWAIIPGGVLLTLAAVAGLDTVSGLETGGIFFLGLAATFGLVASLPRQRESLAWAWIPASIMFVMGILLMLSAGPLVNYFWPVVLILAGLFLVGRSFLKRSAP